MLFRKKKKEEEFEVELVEIIEEEATEEIEGICLSEVEEATDDRELRVEGYDMTEDTFLSNDGDTEFHQ